MGYVQGDELTLATFILLHIFLLIIILLLSAIFISEVNSLLISTRPDQEV